MPPGTSPKKVLSAVRKLAVSEFALKHRYAMVLHIDGAHPHVHVVVKAAGEQGERLNIRKAALRHWRDQFAIHLRGSGGGNERYRARSTRRKQITHKRQYLQGLEARPVDLYRRAENPIGQTNCDGPPSAETRARCGYGHANTS